ncbi:MAG: 5-bromo-4-chloroindolyl phosphate hydrolysis family protein [Oscillospiraceae bacterium]|nr:5-bromo-4-chloroindolyl phosphate hydrolysis family protein [Oscillospiraceae bacterium]
MGQTPQNSPKYPSNDFAWWVITILCFASGGFWWVGLILIFMNTSGKLPPLNAQKRREAEARFRAQTEQIYRNVQAAAQSAAQTAPAPQRKEKKRPGRGRMIAGCVIAAAFSVTAAQSIAAFVQALLYHQTFAEPLSDAIVATVLAVAGAALALSGYRYGARERRYAAYAAYAAMVGQLDEVPLSRVAGATGTPMKKVRKDFQNMIDAGWFGPAAWMDKDANLLRRTPAAEQPPERAMTQDEQILRQIRADNDLIANPEISRKIARIEELTRKIFRLVEERPEKKPQLRSFLDYYLPQTLKILESYARMEAQGVEGENIARAKSQIEVMIDTLVESYEKQLDKLFAGDVLDITSDIAVMEAMLQRDGLTEDLLQPDKT